MEEHDRLAMARRPPAPPPSPSTVTTPAGPEVGSEPTTSARPKRRRHRGIRLRIVVASVGLVTAALGVTVLVTWQVLLSQLDSRIEQDLEQEVEEVRLLAAGVDPATGEPFADDVEAIFDTFLRRSVPSEPEAFYTLVDGRPFLSSFDAPGELLDDPELLESWARQTTPTRLDTETAVGETRMLIVPLSTPDAVAGTFVVAYFPEEERAEVLDAIRVIAWLGVVLVLVSAAVAWSLAGQVLRPVRRLTRTARGITDADLSGRIPVDGHDELAELGHTFNEMVQRLDEGFHAQRRFLDDVAHELRTPITIAQGHLELLGDDPDDVAETIEIVKDELTRMSRYVADLLVLAKAEQPDFLHLGNVDLGELAHDVHLRSAGLADRVWALDETPPPGTAVTVADRGRLEQAILNLALNAVQHTDDGDEIGLGVRIAGTEAHLTVRDTGSGIDPDVVGTLFQRSTRGAGSRASRPDGTGIGLSIVDAIVRAHGGRVDIASTPGNGSAFTLVIPLQSDLRPAEENAR